MSIHPKVNGAYKEMTNCKVKVAGAWKDAQTIYTKVNGVWEYAWQKTTKLFLNVVEYAYVTPRNVPSTPSYATFKDVKVYLHRSSTGELLATKDVGNVKVTYGSSNSASITITVTSSAGCKIYFEFSSNTSKRVLVNANNYPTTTEYYCYFEYSDCVAT